MPRPIYSIPSSSPKPLKPYSAPKTHTQAQSQKKPALPHMKMASLLPETSQKIFNPETLRAAAKQSQRCLVVPVRLRRAIKKYLRGTPFTYFQVLQWIIHMHLYMYVLNWIVIEKYNSICMCLNLTGNLRNCICICEYLYVYVFEFLEVGLGLQICMCDPLFV